MLKFVIPPVKKSLERKYGYYSDWTGLRTFGRMCDLKNSLRQQLFGPRSMDIWGRESELVFQSDANILELVEGEWYTRWEVKKGTSVNDVPWLIEKVQVTTKYYRDSYHPLDTLEYYEGLVERSDYYRSVQVVKRYPTEAESREDYVQWRIAVDRERRNIVTVANPNRVFNEFVSDAVSGNGTTVTTSRIF